MNISKLELVPIRQAFQHEARGFSLWLESNIDALSEQIGLRLTVIAREKEVGSFNVDLLCEDHIGNRVIVENQLERSDHDHLGKLLTYMVNLEAKTAIWVTPDARPEHQRVIAWLNESMGADFSFYLVQVQAVRIGESPYAPLFKVLAAPDEQIREIGETKKELAERDHSRKEFWTGLLERSKGRTKLFSNIKPSFHNWINTGSGRSGIAFTYFILMNRGGIELYIDVGDQERNKAIFDHFYNEKDTIETEFGQPLEWQRLDDKQASRIVKYFSTGSLTTPETWEVLQDEMIDTMIQFDRVFRQRISRLPK